MSIESKQNDAAALRVGMYPFSVRVSVSVSARASDRVEVRVSVGVRVYTSSCKPPVTANLSP